MEPQRLTRTSFCKIREAVPVCMQPQHTASQVNCTAPQTYVRSEWYPDARVFEVLSETLRVGGMGDHPRDVGQEVFGCHQRAKPSREHIEHCLLYTSDAADE